MHEKKDIVKSVMNACIKMKFFYVKNVLLNYFLELLSLKNTKTMMGRWRKNEFA